MKKIQALILSSLLVLVGCNSTSLTNEKLLLDQQQDSVMIGIGGVNLRYRKSGSGQPLLLLHHIRGRLEYFHKIEPTLAQKYTVYAVDLPGHGMSDIPDVDYTAQYQVKMIKRFVKALELDNMIILGESVGGSFALALAADPELSIDKVITINAYDGKYGIGEGGTFAKIFLRLLRSPGIGPRVAKRTARAPLKKILSGGFSDPNKLDDALIDLYLHTAKTREGFGLAGRNGLMNTDTFVGLSESFANITAPVLSIHGEDDWRPAEARKSYVESVASVTHVELPKTGHFASQESPDLVLESVEDFLQ